MSFFLQTVCIARRSYTLYLIDSNSITVSVVIFKFVFYDALDRQYVLREWRSLHARTDN